jgi:hypothetical protein
MPTPPTTPFPTPEPRPAAARGFALDDSPGSWVARQVLGVAEANMTASPVPAEPRAEPVSIRTPPAERFGPPRDRLDVVEREPAAGVTA